MKIIKYLTIIFFYFLLNFFSLANSKEQNFDEWLISFKKLSLSKGVSEVTFNKAMQDVKFLPKVLEYDRFQPEFYEDTITYISKRTGKKKVKKGINLYLKNKEFINSIDKEFNVDKELLLALMGIETNFGTYVGKMDILSSLATLSFDKRRREFFTNELITILMLVDQDIIDYKVLYGSWAGAFGNFQFMPSTIEKYALDYDKNNIIELKTIKDSFASAANYINKIGWKKNQPCYIEIELDKNIPIEFLNTSARKLINKKTFKFFKRYILNSDTYNVDENLIVAIITPDKDIIPDSKNLKPAYVVFNNYELILKWNRSLRFALATCKLKEKFYNEL